MRLNRRQSLALLGSVLLFPLLRPGEALAAGSFRKLGPRVKLGGNVAGTQERVRLGVFSDHRLVATWTNFNASTNTVWYQFLSKNRKLLGSPVEIGNSAGLEAGTALEGRPVTFPDGHSLIFFTADRTNAGADEGKQLFVQRLSKSGAKVGKPVRISSEATGRNDLVFAALLTNGNVMVVWQYQGLGATLDPIDVRCRVVSPSGGPITAERRATKEGPTGRQTPKSIAALSNGRSVFSYVHFDPVGGVYRVACQRLGATGKRLGAPIVLKETSTNVPYGSASVASGLSGRAPAAPGNPEIVKGSSFDAVLLKQAGDDKARLCGGRFSANGEEVVPLHNLSGALRFRFYNEKAPIHAYLEPTVLLCCVEREPASIDKPRAIVGQAGDLTNGSLFAALEVLVSAVTTVLLLDDLAVVRQNADGTVFALGTSDASAAGVHYYFF